MKSFRFGVVLACVLACLLPSPVLAEALEDPLFPAETAGEEQLVLAVDEEQEALSDENGNASSDDEEALAEEAAETPRESTETPAEVSADEETPSEE